MALLTLGIVIPQTTLDAPLGGTNVVKLVQNVLTAIAFWLLTQAATAPGNATLRALNWRAPLLLTLSFGGAFVLIPHRSGTEFLFVENGAAQSWYIWFYGVVHMVGVGLVAIQLSLRAGSRRAPDRLFFIGGGLAASACVSEILDLSMTRLGHPVALISALFDPLFYSGVLIIVGGISLNWIERRKSLQTAQRMLSELRSLTQRLPGPFADTDTTAPLNNQIYALRIAIEDAARVHGMELGSASRTLLEEVDAYLHRGSDAAGTRS